MTEADIAWRRAGRGLLLIGVGVFLLLTTLGRLPWVFWLELAWYWPVILVAVGLRLILARRATPWAVLISPFLVLGTMTYVAIAGVEERTPDWVPVSAERKEETTRWTLDADMAMAQLDVHSRPLPTDVLARGRAASRKHRALMVTHGEDSARVRIGNIRRQWHVVGLPRLREDWELDVSRDLPMSLSFDVAGVSGDLDLTDTTVTSVSVDGAFNDLEFDLGVPVSDTYLSFEGAFNRLVLVVPDETPVRYGRDGFLNIVDGRSSRRREGPAYRVRLDGAFNHISIRSR